MQTSELGEIVELSGEFTDLVGAAANPTTVTLTITAPDGAVTTVTTVGLTNPVLGTWSYNYTPTLVGGYEYRFQGTGTIEQGETNYFVVLAVGSSSPFDGPCQAWTTVANVRACCSSLPASGSADYVTDFVVQSAIDLSSSLLYSLSGQQYPGTCSETVRPCAPRNCYGVYASNWSGLSTYNVPLVDESALEPRGCTCCPVPTVDLGTWWPVTAVTQVLIDGAVVDPATYRVDEFRYLVRLAGPSPDYVNDGWPTCQRLDRPTTEPETFEVTFLHGLTAPPAGQRAASVFACELVKACAGQQCQLPNRVTNVSRQGVSMTLIDSAMLDKGLTGVWEADLFIRSVNPRGYSGGALVWTPDVAPPPRRS